MVATGLVTCRQFPFGRSVPPALLLSLSRVCRDLHTSATGQLAALLHDSFPGQPCLAPPTPSWPATWRCRRPT